MITKQDRTVIRKLIRATKSPVDASALSDQIQSALPHYTPMEIRHFLDDERDRLHAAMVKRAAQQAQLESAFSGIQAKFAKHTPGTTLGDLIDMERAAKDKHGARQQ